MMITQKIAAAILLKRWLGIPFCLCPEVMRAPVPWYRIVIYTSEKDMVELMNFYAEIGARKELLAVNGVLEWVRDPATLEMLKNTRNSRARI